MSNIRIVISGGGTGGHIYPAVAIANALRAADKSIKILFVGALGRMEMSKVPAAGYDIIGLPISGIQRRLTLSNLLFPYKVINSLIKARSVISEFKPNVAVGVGGYASFPLLLVASMIHVPTIIQEQNSYAGISNKFLSRSAKKICVAYEGMEKFFPKKKLILTGNPVRNDIVESPQLRPQALSFFGLENNVKTILVIGGSLGARTINESVFAGLDLLNKSKVQLLWQTGKTYFKNNERLIKELNNKNVKVYEFIFEMNLAYAAADIVISRAGALSISELCMVGKPTILVPSPNVAEDHQTKNAKALSSREAALLISDEEAGEKLIAEAMLLLADEKRQKRYSANISKMAKPQAADDIAKIILEIVEEGRSKK